MNKTTTPKKKKQTMKKRQHPRKKKRKDQQTYLNIIKELIGKADIDYYRNPRSLIINDQYIF